jgi:primary-amine oxidase
LTHLSKDSAPFLIVHGDADTSCPPTQAELLYKGLKRFDASVQLQIGKGGKHGYNDLKVLGEFMDKHLKAGNANVPAPTPKPPLRAALSREKREGLILPAALPLKGWTLPDEGPAKAPEPPPDFKSGHRVDWEGWRFNWALRTREGLVLQDVSFRGRSILKFAGLAEIFVAYDQGAQSIDLAIRHSNYGPLPLAQGIDCSSATWCKAYDAEGKDPAGGAPAVVLMHEEKSGPNYLGMFGRVRGKMLVLWSTMCFSFPDDPDGYVYLIRWKFRDDGTMMPEVGVTGAPRHLRKGETSAVGALVGKDLMDHNVFAESHVHNYLFRLDFDIDQAGSHVVEEFNWRKEPVSAKGQQARCTWTPIGRETGRSCNAETFRSWRVVNRNSRNALGHPRSYQLIPGNTGVYRSDKQPATQSDLWVTVYKPDEFAYSSVDPRPTLQALPGFVDGESVEGKNVVVWYWLGFHHFPRSEDWLHQPVVWKGFELMPRDFLDSSPLVPEE